MDGWGAPGEAAGGEGLCAGLPDGGCPFVGWVPTARWSVPGEAAGGEANGMLAALAG